MVMDGCACQQRCADSAAPGQVIVNKVMSATFASLPVGGLHKQHHFPALASAGPHPAPPCIHPLPPAVTQIPLPASPHHLTIPLHPPRWSAPPPTPPVLLRPVYMQLVSYCAGTGGSLLVIGSAAGVAFMGLEPGAGIGWWVRRVTPWALAGYLAGLGVYIAEKAVF